MKYDGLVSTNSSKIHPGMLEHKIMVLKEKINFMNTLAKQIAFLRKEHSRVHKDVSRLSDALGKIKKLVISSGKSMCPAAVCKCFDKLQKDLDLQEQKTFTIKSDIVSLMLVVPALKRLQALLLMYQV